MDSFLFKATCFTIPWMLVFVGQISGQVPKSVGEDYVGSSPVILGSSSPPIVVTDHGKVARLKCIYNAMPEAKVNWLKEGKEVRHDCDTCISIMKTDVKARTSYLDIMPFEKDDFGEYECRVRNKYGSAKLKIFLKQSDAVQTKCQRERTSSDDPRKKHTFRPVCNDNGFYHEVQCSIELTTCWCVNKHGKKTLDVVAGVNGLSCFAPKDLSGVAIFVFIQGIVMALVMVGHIINVYSGYRITKIVKKYHDYYKERTLAFKKGFKPLKKQKTTKRMKMRKLPSIPVESHPKSN